jgi:hypothetical protein
VLLLPSRPSSACYDAARKSSRVERDAERLMRIQHEFVAPCAVVGGPRAKQAAEIAADASHMPAELACIDPNPHVRPPHAARCGERSPPGTPRAWLRRSVPM